MKRKLLKLNYLIIFTLLAGTTLSVNAQIRAYRVSDRQVQTLLSRIETNTDAFKTQADRSLDRSVLNGSRSEDSLNNMVSEFERATDALRNNFTSRRSTGANVEEVISRAAVIDAFVMRSRLANLPMNTWSQIKSDLNTLAGYYNVQANWNARVYTGGNNVGGYSRSNDAVVRELLQRLDRTSTQFKNAVGRNLNRSNVNGTNREDDINAMVAAFDQAMSRLRNSFNAGRSTGAEAQDVLNRAVAINRLMLNSRLNARAENEWNQIRTDLNTLSGYYSVRADWDGTPIVDGANTGYYGTTESELRNALSRLDNRSTAFRQSFNQWAARNRVWPGGVRQDLNQFDRALEAFSRNYDIRSSGSANLQRLLSEAASINNFLTNSNINNRQVTSSWEMVRQDLDTVAGYYRLTTGWNGGGGGGFNNNVGGSFDTRLTGAYRLNRSLSDNVTTTVDRAIANASFDANRRDRVRRTLEQRLTPSELVTVEKRGNNLTIWAGAGTPVSLTLGGAAVTETSPSGRTVTTTVSSTDRDVTINYEGDRMNDYYISFTPFGNDQLRVVRRVYLENQNDMVTVTSVYDRTSSTVDWNSAAYNTGGGRYNNPNINRASGFIVPNSTTLTATLNNAISTRNVREGDRFTLNVTSPGQYSGAVIEGTVVGEQSGAVSGRANLSMSFDTIRMRDGRTYNFAGIIDRIQNERGEVVNVNNEGTVRDSSQTNKTVTRAGIGAALGALIGAIAGGGSGAAVGAAVGAGAGAGSVILQGKDNLELGSGSQFTITATGPNSVGIR